MHVYQFMIIINQLRIQFLHESIIKLCNGYFETHAGGWMEKFGVLNLELRGVQPEERYYEGRSTIHSPERYFRWLLKKWDACITKVVRRGRGVIIGVSAASPISIRGSHVKKIGVRCDECLAHRSHARDMYIYMYLLLVHLKDLPKKKKKRYKRAWVRSLGKDNNDGVRE